MGSAATWKLENIKQETGKLSIKKCTLGYDRYIKDDAAGAYTANRVYTVLGKQITANTDRNAFVGDWGYQPSTSVMQVIPTSQISSTDT